MANRGYVSAGGVLVNQLADGVSLDSVWDEINEATSLYNEHRSALASLLTFPTTAAGDSVPQAGTGYGDKFEEASEFGVPSGIGAPQYLKIGFTLKDWDIASRFTAKALRNMTSQQVTHATQRVFEADNRLVNASILKRLFDPTEYENEWGIPCYGLWNGQDGLVPPAHMGKTFGADTSMYVSTASATLDAADVEGAIRKVKQFGYGTTQNARFVLLIHPDDLEESGATTWRAGKEYTTGKIAKYDFIPSPNAPSWLSSESIHGATVPADYAGLPVVGSYGSALIIESHFIPTGWATVVATGGPNSEQNVIGYRESAVEAYQGLRVIPGPQQHPLLQTYYVRSFGTGVRHRGAACAIQITTDSGYTAPVIEL